VAHKNRWLNQLAECVDKPKTLKSYAIRRAMRTQHNFHIKPKFVNKISRGDAENSPIRRNADRG